MNDKFDLLSTVTYGGCSAKLSAAKLSELLSEIPLVKDSNILVDISTHDDAGVYRLNDDTALIVTTDFFPPICSDAYTFGQVAAANSLSDVYAMGGKPLLALNLNMFPKDLPLEVLRDILLGGQSKITEAGAFTMGGHTIEDGTPKYGLAVVGIVAPDKVVANSGAKVGQKMILTKPLGTGSIIAARRLELASDESYEAAIRSMSTLNDVAADVMQQMGVTGATDITGFGLIGHATKMASASGVTITLDGSSLPLLPEVESLIDMGCVAGATFRNKEFTDDRVEYLPSTDTICKMAALDAQTSGGLFMAIDADKAQEALSLLHSRGAKSATIVGDVIEKGEKDVLFY